MKTLQLKSVIGMLVLMLITTVTALGQDCPNEIKKLGAGKLQAAFGNKEVPKSIQVEGTSDERFVSNGGIWLSNEKYATTKQTLIMKAENNTQLDKCAYDEQGKLVVTPPNTCNAVFISVTSAGLTITWTMQDESGIREYNIVNDAGEVVHTQPNEDNLTYDYTTPAPGIYTVVAVCVTGGTSTSPQVTTTNP